MLKLQGKLTLQSEDKVLMLESKNDSLHLKASNWSVFYALLKVKPSTKTKRSSLYTLFKSIRQDVIVSVDGKRKFYVLKGRVRGISWSSIPHLLKLYLRSIF